jgi:hypothetical protein
MGSCFLTPCTELIRSGSVLDFVTIVWVTWSRYQGLENTSRNSRSSSQLSPLFFYRLFWVWDSLWDWVGKVGGNISLFFLLDKKSYTVTESTYTHKDGDIECPNMTETRLKIKISSELRDRTDEHVKHGKNWRCFIQYPVNLQGNTKLSAVSRMIKKRQWC